MSATVNRANAQPNESDEVSHLGRVLNRNGPVYKVSVLIHVLRVVALLLVLFFFRSVENWITAGERHFPSHQVGIVSSGWRHSFSRQQFWCEIELQSALRIFLAFTLYL